LLVGAGRAGGGSTGHTGLFTTGVALAVAAALLLGNGVGECDEEASERGASSRFCGLAGSGCDDEQATRCGTSKMLESQKTAQERGEEERAIIMRAAHYHDVARARIHSCAACRIRE